MMTELHFRSTLRSLVMLTVSVKCAVIITFLLLIVASKNEEVLPFPSAKVNNNKATVLKTVNVMEHIEGRCSEFVLDVSSRIFGS